MTAVPIATVFGGPLSGALLGLHGYLGVEAGVGSSSSRAPSPCCSGSSPSSSSRTGRRTSNGSHLRSVMHSISALPLRRKRPAPMAILELARRSTNPCVIQLGLVYFCLVVGLYRIGFWMPQVLQTFGLYNLSIGFLTAIPYLIAAIGMVIAGTPLRCQGRAHLACGAAALCVGRGLRLVGKCRAPSAHHACALACRPRTLCRHRHFWSLPTSPDLHRRRGGARAYQLHRQLRWICRASHRWALEGGDGRLHRGASVPCRCARLGRGLALHFGQVEDRRWRARGAA